MADDNAIWISPYGVYADFRFPGLTAALLPKGLPPFPIIPRRMFTYTPPRDAEMKPLGGVHCITVHHSGFPEPFLTEDLKQTADYLEGIRQFHTGKRDGQRGWGDIGYHFAVDRAGRVWQLRSMQYQGAHVKNHNADNLGIVVLGNFDMQAPAGPQLAALRQFLDWLVTIYGLSRGSVFPHGTLADAPTACPGRNLSIELNAWQNGR